MRWVSRHPRSSSYSGENPWLSWFICKTFPSWHATKIKLSATSVGCLTSSNLLPVPGFNPLGATHHALSIFLDNPSRCEAHRESPSAFHRCGRFSFPANARFTFLSCAIFPPVCLIRLSHGVFAIIPQRTTQQRKKCFFSFFPLAYFHDDMAQILLPSRSAMAAHNLVGHCS